MAWTQTNQASATTKSAGTVLNLNPGTNPVAGSIVLVEFSTDNPDNVGPAETTHHTVSDDQGNVWTKIREYQGSGNANATVTVSLWISHLDTTITGNIIGTLDVSRNAKVLLMDEFTVGAGKTFFVAGNSRDEGNGILFNSGTISGLANIEHLFIGAVGIEGPSGDTFNEDTSFTQDIRAGTTGGGAAGNQTANIARQILTATSESYTPGGSGRDWVSIIAAIDEVDLPASEKTPFSLTADVNLEHEKLATVDYFNPMPQRFGSEPDNLQRVVFEDEHPIAPFLVEVGIFYPPRLFIAPPERSPIILSVEATPELITLEGIGYFNPMPQRFGSEPDALPQITTSYEPALIPGPIENVSFLPPRFFVVPVERGPIVVFSDQIPILLPAEEPSYFNPMPQRFGSEPDSYRSISVVDETHTFQPIYDISYYTPARFVVVVSGRGPSVVVVNGMLLLDFLVPLGDVSMSLPVGRELPAPAPPVDGRSARFGFSYGSFR